MLLFATHSFQFMQISGDVVKLNVCGALKQEYIEGITALVKEFFGVPFALCYDCRVYKLQIFPFSVRLLRDATVSFEWFN